eukprot:747718-Prorocentrum_minimum.AAC.1
MRPLFVFVPPCPWCRNEAPADGAADLATAGWTGRLTGRLVIGAQELTGANEQAAVLFVSGVALVAQADTTEARVRLMRALRLSHSTIGNHQVRRSSWTVRGSRWTVRGSRWT